ncbi:MAG: Purine nucleoside phosphoramidase [Candidatus Anoxychlamydiales bacterium]|nr:Purine nucleoside phosphoramidase [Candidatus Anoxychlamydiales bacterium]
METIFEKIINRKIPAEILLENEHVIAIKDISPKAPVHILIITKKVIPSFQELKEEDYYLLGEVAKAANKLAKEFNIEKGFRILSNTGTSSGQTIYHLHFHLLGGRDLNAMG